MQRFLRTELLVGREPMRQLLQARVMVVGLGAVGSYAVEALARGGVGNLILVDHDRVELSNINRQLYALESTIGEAKCKLAADRVHNIHPDCHVEALPLFVDGGNMGELLDRKPDFVVDAIDSLQSKADLLAAAWERGIPVVSSMGAALRIDPARILVDDLYRTQGCPLARALRRILKKRGIGPGIRCVYSLEPPAPSHSPETVPGEEDSHSGPRNVLGSFPTVPGIFGLILAGEVLCRLGGLSEG